MRRVFLILCILCYTGIILSQVTSTSTLTEKQFKSVFNKEFAKLANPDASSNIGTYGAFDPSGKVNFGASILTNKGWMWGLNAKGGVSDGMLAVFQNSTFSKNVSGELQVHNLSKLTTKTFTYYNDSKDVYDRKLMDINNKYDKLLLEKRLGIPQAKIQSQQRKLAGEIASNQAAIAKLSTQRLNAVAIENLCSSPTNDSLKTALKMSSIELTAKIDSLTSENALKQLETSALAVELNNLNKNITQDTVLLKNEQLNAQKDLKLELELYEIAFGWLSANFKVSNNSFKHFDSTMPADSQVTSQNYTSIEFGVKFNYVHWTLDPKKQNYYSLIGIAFSNTDNFSDLQKIEITEVKQHGANPGDRSITQKYDAYTGTYKDTLMSARIYADHYHFLSKSKKVAIHGFGEVVSKTDMHPQYNAGGGVLFCLDSESKDKPVVNIELYYKALDMTNVAGSNLPHYQRNEIGLRGTFPITFKTK